jgi:hypothetical protein
MTVASLELCRELYTLSAWTDTNFYWSNVTHSFVYVNDYILIDEDDELRSDDSDIPAYDLGYLLRKLQNPKFQVAVMAWPNGTYSAACYEAGDRMYDMPDADAATPEDAVALLAIALFKQDVLQRSGQ